MYGMVHTTRVTHSSFNHGVRAVRAYALANAFTQGARLVQLGHVLLQNASERSLGSLSLPCASSLARHRKRFREEIKRIRNMLFSSSRRRIDVVGASALHLCGVVAHTARFVVGSPRSQRMRASNTDGAIFQFSLKLGFNSTRLPSCQTRHGTHEGASRDGARAHHLECRGVKFQRNFSQLQRKRFDALHRGAARVRRRGRVTADDWPSQQPGFLTTQGWLVHIVEGSQTNGKVSNGRGVRSARRVQLYATPMVRCHVVWLAQNV